MQRQLLGQTTENTARGVRKANGRWKSKTNDGRETAERRMKTQWKVRIQLLLLLNLFFYDVEFKQAVVPCVFRCRHSSGWTHLANCTCGNPTWQISDRVTKRSCDRSDTFDKFRIMPVAKRDGFSTNTSWRGQLEKFQPELRRTCYLRER